MKKGEEFAPLKSFFCISRNIYHGACELRHKIGKRKNSKTNG